MKKIKEIYAKAIVEPKKKREAQLQKLLKDPSYYNPFSTDPRVLKKSTAMLKEGIKAIPKGLKARANTRKNIKSMANLDAMAELKRTKKLPADQRGANSAYNRAGKAYSNTKKTLEKQIPRKYRSYLGL